MQVHIIIMIITNIIVVGDNFIINTITIIIITINIITINFNSMVGFIIIIIRAFGNFGFTFNLYALPSYWQNHNIYLIFLND